MPQTRLCGGMRYIYTRLKLHRKGRDTEDVRGGCVHEFLDLVAEVIAVRALLCQPASNKKTA